MNTYTKNGLVTKYFIKFLVQILPRHGVRAVFLTTLAGEILGDEDELELILPIINEKFHLVNNYHVLEFPKMIYSELWEEESISIREPKTIHGAELTGLAERIMRITPQWCAYDDHVVVLNDTISMVKFCLDRMYSCRKDYQEAAFNISLSKGAN